MAASTFDSLAAMCALEAAGVERKHAEAHAEQLRAAAAGALEQPATKAATCKASKPPSPGSFAS